MNDIVKFKPGRGGARPGAGRPPKAPGDPLTRKQTDNERFVAQRARHEEIKADQRALMLKIQSGEYVSRTAVRDAAAMVLSALAQGLRSLPDNLERKFSLSGDVADEISRTIDASLADVAEGLALFTSDKTS